MFKKRQQLNPDTYWKYNLLLFHGGFPRCKTFPKEPQLLFRRRLLLLQEPLACLRADRQQNLNARWRSQGAA